ncbi:hypothetical protein LT493_42825 [Streptomyces tricolor]|nr:hypothetical protein [Streptomyces tricolor]
MCDRRTTPDGQGPQGARGRHRRRLLDRLHENNGQTLGELGCGLCQLDAPVGHPAPGRADRRVRAPAPRRRREATSRRGHDRHGRLQRTSPTSRARPRGRRRSPTPT